MTAKRMELFDYFRKKFPSEVSIPYGKFSRGMQFTTGDYASLSFDFLWEIRFLHDGRSTSQIELSPRYSLQFAKEGKGEDFARRFKEEFKNLSGMKGIKGAIKEIMDLALKQKIQ
eukprot:TRINITY_DN3895_c0_g1_i1.p2 TRINITY_DN3895_c0_g1~~TRINITY_DN3895_c0_g1_i1.p2  ORF type:complete len:115 (+),score=33.26 TRINITY_DN3895_c0_g1_i1:509-853(+)